MFYGASCRQSTSTAGKKAKEKKTTESTTKPAAMPSNVEQVDASRADLSKHSAMNKPQVLAFRSFFLCSFLYC